MMIYNLPDLQPQQMNESGGTPQLLSTSSSNSSISVMHNNSTMNGFVSLVATPPINSCVHTMYPLQPCQPNAAVPNLPVVMLPIHPPAHFPMPITNTQFSNPPVQMLSPNALCHNVRNTSTNSPPVKSTVGVRKEDHRVAYIRKMLHQVSTDCAGGMQLTFCLMSTCAFFAAYLMQRDVIIPYLPRELIASTMLCLAGRRGMDIQTQSTHWPSANIEPANIVISGTPALPPDHRKMTSKCRFCKQRRSVTIPFAIHLMYCPAKEVLIERKCKNCGESLKDDVTWQDHNAVCSNTLPQDSNSSSGDSNWK